MINQSQIYRVEKEPEVSRHLRDKVSLFDSHKHRPSTRTVTCSKKMKLNKLLIKNRLSMIELSFSPPLLGKVSIAVTKISPDQWVLSSISSWRGSLHESSCYSRTTGLDHRHHKPQLFRKRRRTPHSALEWCLQRCRQPSI